MREENLLLWRLAFDRHGNIVANGKHPVGRVTWVHETEICFGTFMWNGNFIERRAKPEGATQADSAEERQRLAKVALLKELKLAAGLVQPTVVALGTVH